MHDYNFPIRFIPQFVFTYSMSKIRIKISTFIGLDVQIATNHFDINCNSQAIISDSILFAQQAFLSLI